MIIERIAKCHKWLHKNGKIYKVLYIANIYAKQEDRSEYPVMVVYTDESNVVWSKTPEEFIRSRTEYVCDVNCVAKRRIEDSERMKKAGRMAYSFERGVVVIHHHGTEFVFEEKTAKKLLSHLDEAIKNASLSDEEYI